MEYQKICCFLNGENRNFFPLKENTEEKMEEFIKDLKEKEGITDFFTGLEEGEDLLAAKTVAENKWDKPVSLTCVIPFEEQAAHYGEEVRDIYFSVAEKCDGEILLSKKRTANCRKIRDIFMIEKSDVIVAFLKEEDQYFSSLLPFIKDKKVIFKNGVF